MLDQRANESLQRSVNRTVDHHGPVRLVVRSRIFQLETLRKLKIELDRRALPETPEGVPELHVNLWSVEGAAASVDAVRNLFALERTLERLLGPIPGRVVPQLLRRPRRDFEVQLEPEVLSDETLDLIEAEKNLVFRLIERAEDVGVIHGEAPDAQQAVQHARFFVAVHVRDFRQPERQVPVAPRLRLVYERVHRAVHRLYAIPHVLRFARTRAHRRILVRL